jgi:hypothetical protein
VRLEEAIERSGVPRTTAYRVFKGPDGPLETFRAALLEDISVSWDEAQSFELTAELLASFDDVIASGDAAAMADAFKQIIRLAVNQRLHAQRQEMNWRAYVSTLLATDGAAAASAGVAAGERFVPLYRAIGEVFGVRPKPPLDWVGLSSVIVAVTDGSAMRALEDASIREIALDGPDTETDEHWDAAAVLTLGLFLVWCEPDPDAECTAALERWTAFGALADSSD